MPVLLPPSGPSKAKVLDVLEAAVISAHDPEAATRAGDSAVHVATQQDSAPRIVSFLAAVAIFGPVVRLLAFRSRRVVQAHFEASEDLNGISVRTSGPNVAMQYDLLVDLAVLLAKWGHITHEQADEAVAAMVQT